MNIRNPQKQLVGKEKDLLSIRRLRSQAMTSDLIHGEIAQLQEGMDGELVDDFQHGIANEMGNHIPGPENARGANYKI